MIDEFNQLIITESTEDPNGTEVFEFLDKNAKDNSITDYSYKQFILECFKVMNKRPICATSDNFEMALQQFMKIVNQFPLHIKIKEINDFSAIVVNIPFSEKERNKILHNFIIFLQKNNEEIIKSSLEKAKFLFPFIAHIYVDYDKDIIAPIYILQNLLTLAKSDNDYDAICYYSVCYIWKILNSIEKFTTNKLFKSSEEDLEINIFFNQDDLKKEIKEKDTNAIYLKTKNIEKNKVIEMIVFLISSDKTIFSYLINSRNNTFFFMISQICYNILRLIKEDYDLLMKFYLVMYDISNSKSFEAANNFKPSSFLYEVLIDFYPETKGKKKFGNFLILRNFIFRGPPFFSVNKSRENKLEFLKDNGDHNSVGYLYSGFPSEHYSNHNYNMPQDKPDFTIYMSRAIQYDDFPQENNSMLDIKSFLANNNKLDDLIEYVVNIAPFFLFREAKKDKSPLENNGKFHKLFRELLNQNKDISKKISNGIYAKYIQKEINNNNDNNNNNNKNKYNQNIDDNVGVTEFNESIKSALESSKMKKLENLFQWYLLQLLIEIEVKEDDKASHKKEQPVIKLHIEESSNDCKNLFIELFILSLPEKDRDDKLFALFQYKNSDILLKGIRESVKEYCDKYHLMHSEIYLISQDDVDEKLDKMNKYLIKSLEKIKYKDPNSEYEKSRAHEILGMAIKQIKYKIDENGKKSATLSQMCKKIFNSFDTIFGNGTNDTENNQEIKEIDSFILQLFISFAYESVNIIPTKTSLKRITKILNKLNPKQSKAVIVSLFNFFEGRRLQNELILKIAKNDQIYIAKQNVIGRNSGHLYRFNTNICFDCKEKVACDAGIVQFFSCGHIFHIFNCTGIRKNNFYKSCPVCPKENKIGKNSKKNKLNVNKNALKVYQNPSFEYYFNSKDERFHSSLESIPDLFETMNFPTCIADPHISINVTYNEVESFFDKSDDIVLNFDENNP